MVLQFPPGSATRVAGRLNSSVRALELLMRRTKGHPFKVWSLDKSRVVH